MWRFSDKITEEVPDGEFTEKAVSTIKEYQIVYFINKFKERFGRHKHSQRWGDGKSIYERVPLKQRLLRRVKNIFGSSISVCSFDGASSMNLEKYLKRCNGYLLMVSHPKCLTTQGLKDLDAFISRHKNDLDFTTISHQ